MKTTRPKGSKASRDDFDDYLKQEDEDNRRKDEWIAHSMPNAQGLYDIGWYADQIGTPHKPDTITDIHGNVVEVTPGAHVDGRPYRHGKQFVGGFLAANGGAAVPARIGQAVPGASRGVGQPTIDGFINNNAMAQWKTLPDDTKKQVLASYIKNNIISNIQHKVAQAALGALNTNNPY